MLETCLAYLGFTVIPRLPRRVVLVMARGLARLGYRISRKTRRIAVANVEFAFGDTKTPAEKEEIVRQSYRTFTLVTLDLFWFARHSEARIREYVEFNSLYETIREAKPSVSVTGHIGNWEILGQTVSVIDPPFSAVAAPLDNPAVDKLLNRIRQTGRQRVTHKRGAMREAIRVLKEGGRIGLLLDQNILPNEGGKFVDFFGAPVPMSSAAEKLAKKMAVPITFGFCRPREDGHYVLSSRDPMPHDTQEAGGDLTQAIAKVLECEIRKDPGCWLWMYKRWKYVPTGVSLDKYPYYAKPVEEMLDPNT